MKWGKGSLLLLNVKWNTLSLTGKELSAAFFSCFPHFFFRFKPCTHLTVTTRTCRREVFQTSQAGGSVRGYGRGCQGQAEMDGCVCVCGGAHEIKSEERAGHPCYRPIAFKVEARCFRLHLWTYKIRRSGEGFNEMCANQEWIKTFNYDNTSVHPTYSSEGGSLIAGLIKPTRMTRLAWQPWNIIKCVRSSTRFEAIGRFLNFDIRRLPSVV